MRILYVVSRAIQINSSSSIRNLASIRGLAELGHKVTVLSAMYDKNHSNYDEKLEPEGVDKIYLTVGGIQKAAAVSRRYRGLEGLRKTASRFLSVFQVYDSLKGITRCIEETEIQDDSYDLVISSSDPKSSHLFVYELYQRKRLKKTPWVQIWGDPFAADITNTSLIYRWKAKREEEKLLGKASKIVYVSKLTLEQQKKEYSAYREKMLFSPPAYLEERRTVPENVKHPMKVVYCGNYSSSARNILPFYHAMQKSGYSVMICGNGDAEILDTANLKHRSRVTFGEAEQVEEEADVLVYLCNKKGSQIPGKIYQYMGTCKYILFILDGDRERIREIFEPYQRFVFCGNQEEEILDSLREIESGKFEKTRFVVKEFSPESRAAWLLRQVTKE